MSVLSEVKQRREQSQIFRLKKNEVKHCREHSQRFHFKSQPSKTA